MDAITDCYSLLVTPTSSCDGTSRQQGIAMQRLDSQGPVQLTQMDALMTCLQESKLSIVAHSVVSITPGIDFDGFYYLSTSYTRGALSLHQYEDLNFTMSIIWTNSIMTLVSDT
jgi:hypothetical protein